VNCLAFLGCITSQSRGGIPDVSIHAAAYTSQFCTLLRTDAHLGAARCVLPREDLDAQHAVGALADRERVAPSPGRWLVPVPVEAGRRALAAAHAGDVCEKAAGGTHQTTASHKPEHGRHMSSCFLATISARNNMRLRQGCCDTVLRLGGLLRLAASHHDMAEPSKRTRLAHAGGSPPVREHDRRVRRAVAAGAGPRVQLQVQV